MVKWQFVTVDLDNPTITEVVKAWNRIGSLGTELRGRVSASGYGVHLRAEEASETELAVRERRMLGDDPHRIELDIERQYRPPQVLFDVKEGERAGPWTEDLDGLIRMYRDSTGYTY